MQFLRKPCGPAVALRSSSQAAWLHRVPPGSSTPLVSRALGAIADHRYSSTWQEDSPNVDADTPQASDRTLRPRGSSRAYGDGGYETARPSGGYDEREPRRRRLFNDAGGEGEEGSGGGPSTSGRDRRLDSYNQDRDFRRRDRGGGRGRGRGGSSSNFGSRRRNDFSQRDGDDDDVDRRGFRRDDEGRRGRGGRGREGRGDRDSRRRSDRFDNRPPPEGHRERRTTEPRDPAANTLAEAAPVVRPPGSSTGNRPLPYDLPLVRPDDGDKGTFFAGSSWRQAGAIEDVVSALKSLGISRPSHIQAMAFSALCGLNGSGTGSGASDSPLPAVVLADQAGSGKTLSYLLPMMQILRQEEVAAGGRVTTPKCPRGIVLAPTVELVQQVLRVARALSGAGLRCRTAAFTGGQKDDKARAASFRTQKELLAEGVDLVVATPGRLQQHLVEGSLELTHCRMIVMDEVDVLLGDRADFSSQVGPLRAAAPPSLRFVMVTATLPQHTFAELREMWSGAGGVRTVFGPGLHRTAAGLVEELVDCSGGDEVTEESGRKRKLEALKALLERHRSARTIVFCNKIDACRDVENFLSRVDPKQRQFRVLPYHEAIRDDLRAEAMAEFLKPVKQQPRQQQQQQKQQQPPPAGSAPAERPGQSAQDEHQTAEADVPLVLVATDRTSRGIDVLYCEHVVLFDFPRDPSEYVRRVGRTARGAGGRGTVSSLVLGRQVPLAREIIERNQKGMPLHSLPE